MVKIIFDSNIYDLLEEDPATVELMRTVVQAEVAQVMMPRQVAEELHKRPRGFPDLFQTKQIGHAVARAGILRAGDFIGRGDTFDVHKGDSNKEEDAFIVDVAAMVADWFVSEDRRSLGRFPTTTQCIPLRYQAFCERLRAL